MANEVDSGNHITHANGLSALLNIKHLPLNPLITLKSGPTKIPQPSKVSSPPMELYTDNLFFVRRSHL